MPPRRRRKEGANQSREPVCRRALKPHPGGHWKRSGGRHKLPLVRKSPPRVPVARDGAPRKGPGHGSRPPPQRRTRSRGPTPRRCGVRGRPPPCGASEGMKRDMTTVAQGSWVERIAKLQDSKSYQELHWEGTFEEYLNLVRQNPRVTRTAFQRIYDMILSHGRTEYIDNKKKLVRYHFFADEKFGGRDAIFGLDVPLMKLVNVFKSAAQQYGTEKRVILLHGPVGSSKSTIARLMKKGMEEYSKMPEGAAYTFTWLIDKKGADGSFHKERMKCPMNEEPLNLIPREWRPKVFAELQDGGDFQI